MARAATAAAASAGAAKTSPPVPLATSPAAPVAKPSTGGLTIVRADKRRGRLRVGVTGPSGSGKTYTSLVLAAGTVGVTLRPDGRARVLVVDTENGSANDYGANGDGVFPVVPFDLIEIRPPYTVEKYELAYRMAESEGYELIVYDSLYHAWKGEGGMLDEKEKMDSRGGSKFANWAPVTEKFNRFRSLLLNNRIHLIGTLRSKMDYSVDPATGKPTKIGLAPEMRDGLEYEFTVVFDLDIRHQAAISKDRTGLFAGRGLFVPTAATGKELIDWRMSGRDEIEPPKVIATEPERPATPKAKPGKPVAAPTAESTAAAAATASVDDVRSEIRMLLEKHKVDAKSLKAELGIPSGTLSAESADKMLKRLRAIGADRAEAGA